jgi:hypothetical protein
MFRGATDNRYELQHITHAKRVAITVALMRKAYHRSVGHEYSVSTTRPSSYSCSPTNKNNSELARNCTAVGPSTKVPLTAAAIAAAYKISDYASFKRLSPSTIAIT